MKTLNNMQNISAVLQAIQKEQSRADNTIHMTANENLMSKTARYFLSSNLGYRYHVGTYDDQPDLATAPFYLVHNELVLRGLPSVFALEEIARLYANKMFNANYCDFKPLSGMHAVFCILSTATKPRDCVYVFPKASVAHHATVSLLNNIDRKVCFLPWNVKEVTIDLDQLAKQVKLNKPDVIFFDFGTTFYPLPIKEIRQIVGDEVLIIYDGSHVLGLIAGEMFQNPLEEGCDILIGNTHKTFPGPQKAMLTFKDEGLGRKISKRLFESAISTQHTHHAIALYISIIEMMEHGRDYAAQIVKNNHALSKALIANGFEIFSRNNELPCSHMLAITGGFPKNNHHACAELQKSNISTNSKNICGFDAIRLGIQEITYRGMKEQDMLKIATFFKEIIQNNNKQIVSEIQEFNNQFNQLPYTLDDCFAKIIQEK
jgi:glycine hydroxymethyltransferase